MKIRTVAICSSVILTVSFFAGIWWISNTNLKSGLSIQFISSSMNSPRTATVEELDISNDVPVIAIVTPVVKFVEESLSETVLSVLAQSFQRWELILVDDSSSKTCVDNLVNFVNRCNDTRLRLVCPVGTLGLPGARNFGAKATNAPLLYFLDDDDKIEVTALEKLLFLILTNPMASFANGWVQNFGSNNFTSEIGFNVRAQFLKSNPVACSALLKASSFWKVGGFNESMKSGLEDWNLWIKMAEQGMWGFTVPEHLFFYRRRQTQSDRWPALRKSSLRKFREQIKLKESEFPSIPCPQYSPFEPIYDLPFFETGTKFQKKSILFILPWLVLGGADRFNLNMVRYLVQQDWHVTIVCTLIASHTWHSEFRALTADIFILPNFLPLSAYPMFLNYLIHSRGCDVVLTSNSAIGYFLMPYLRSKAPDSTVFVDYAHIEAEEWMHGGYPRLASGLSPLYDINFVSSRHLANWVIQHGAVPQSVQVLPVGVDTDLFKRNTTERLLFRHQHNIPYDSMVILFPARITEQKQPDILIEVIRHFQPHRDVVFVVAGDGDKLKWMKQMISQVSSMVLFLGAVAPDDMIRVMSGSDILLLTSKIEGIPCSIFEGMSMGLAVVAPNVGGISDLVDEKTGVLVEIIVEKTSAPVYEDKAVQVDRFVGALETFISTKGVEILQRLSHAGRQRAVDNFDLSVVGKLFVRSINDAVKTKMLGIQFSSNLQGLGHELAKWGLALTPLHMSTHSNYCR